MGVLISTAKRSRLAARAGAAGALYALALLVAVPAQAGAETFEVFTFTPPPGARNVLAEAVSFTDATPVTFAIYGVYRSARSSGHAARDFADEWIFQWRAACGRPAR